MPNNKKSLSKNNNKSSRIFMEYKAFNNNINNNKNLIRHCSSYKHFYEKEKNDINKIKPLIKTNSNYISLKKSNTIEKALDNLTNKENDKKRIDIFKKENEIYKKNFSDKYVEKKGNVCKGKNNIPTSKIKYRNILYRNKVRNPKVKSFSYSNFYRQKFS